MKIIVPDVNLELYKSLYLVHYYGSITRAAEHMNRDRTGVSKNISCLERELGVKLFTRSSREIKRTAIGEKLYQEIEQIFEKLSFLVNDLKEINEESTGEIRIVCATNSAIRMLAKTISEFKNEYPKVNFFIINKNNAAEAIEMLERREADLAFDTMPMNTKDVKFEIEALKNLSVTFIAIKEFEKIHGLTEIITKEQFENLPLVSHEVIQSRKQLTFATTQEVAIQLVINNVGVGYCMEQYLDNHNQKDLIFRFKVEDMIFHEFTLNCIFDKDYLTKPASVFLNKLKESLGQTKI